jgi:hypothetical protein
VGLDFWESLGFGVRLELSSVFSGQKKAQLIRLGFLGLLGDFSVWLVSPYSP